MLKENSKKRLEEKFKQVFEKTQIKIEKKIELAKKYIQQAEEISEKMVFRLYQI